MGTTGWARRLWANARSEQARSETPPPLVDDEKWPHLTPVERVEAVVATLVDRRTATASSPIGLSPGEIQAIDNDQSAPIGAAYRRFLELVGGGVGSFLQGSDVFDPLILGLGRAADDLLVENDVPFTLSPTDRVIFMHQGYSFDFLRGTGADPEVWSYSETYHPDLNPFHNAPTFTDWFRTLAEQHRAHIEARRLRT